MADGPDLTDYVTLAAKEYAQPYDWERLPEEMKYTARELMLPVVTVILKEYKKNHPEKEDTSWMDSF